MTSGASKIFAVMGSACALLLSIPVHAGENLVVPKNHLPVIENIRSEMIEKACTAAVLSEQLPTKRIRIDSLVLSPGQAKCVARVTIVEGSGLVMNGGTFTTTPAEYSVSVDLATGKTQLARLEEFAARDVATIALANAMMQIRPVEIKGTEITYKASVGRESCLVTIGLKDEGYGPSRWYVTKLDCPKGKTKAER